MFVSSGQGAEVTCREDDGEGGGREEGAGVQDACTARVIAFATAAGMPLGAVMMATTLRAGLRVPTTINRVFGY